MLVRLCDRCGVAVSGAPSAIALAVPIAAPATKPNKVTADPFPVSLALAVQGAVDLCSICLAAALVELLVVVLTGGGLTDKQAKRLEARIDDAVSV